MNIMALHGTLIAAFLTRDEIFLASDGRVIHNKTGQIHNDWSKVHQINKYVGMLTAGAFIPPFKDAVVRNCNDRNIRTVEGVVQVASLILTEFWRSNVERIKQSGRLDEFRVFVFIAGFDVNNCPRLFYLDNMSKPKFSIQVRQLFQNGHDFEIGALSTGSGQEEDPSGLLTQEINCRIQQLGIIPNLSLILYSAFSLVKDKLSKTNSRIGGKTFLSKIDRTDGFKDISDVYQT
jgi:hypothetical protein